MEKVVIFRKEKSLCILLPYKMSTTLQYSLIYTISLNFDGSNLTDNEYNVLIRELYVKI